MIKEVRADVVTDGAGVTGVSARGRRRPTDCPENHVPNSTTTTYMTTRPYRRYLPALKSGAVDVSLTNCGIKDIADGAIPPERIPGPSMADPDNRRAHIALFGP